MATVEAGATLGRARGPLRPASPGAHARSPGRRRAQRGRRAGHARQRPAPLPLRHRARSPAGRALRAGRRHADLGRRQGRQVGDGLRRAEAPGRLARHPRRARRGRPCGCTRCRPPRARGGSGFPSRAAAARVPGRPARLAAPARSRRAARRRGAGAGPGSPSTRSGSCSRSAARPRRSSTRAGPWPGSRPSTAGGVTRCPTRAWAGARRAWWTGPLLLRATGEPRRLLDWVGEAHAAAIRAGAEVMVLAQPGHGRAAAVGPGGLRCRPCRDGPRAAARRALEARGWQPDRRARAGRA